MAPKSPSPLQGTLDLIVLHLLRAEPTNGYELAQRVQAISRDVLNVNAGSLYPAPSDACAPGCERVFGVDQQNAK